MPDRQVVCDTSPLLYLHQIGQLDLLKALYGRVIVPEAVVEELRQGAAQGASVPRVDEAPWLQVRSLPDRALLPAILDLGKGEAKAIGLAHSLENSLVVLDEALGRRIARLLDLNVTGTLGTLLRAKEAGLVARIKPLIEALQLTTMYLSKGLIEDTLRKAGELVLP